MDATAVLINIKITENCKSKCCKKFKKGEEKRCKRCPMLDLLKKIDSLCLEKTQNN